MATYGGNCIEDFPTMAYTRSPGSIYLLSTESGQTEADKIVNVRARVCLKYRPISRPDKVWARRRRVDFISFIFLKQEVGCGWTIHGKTSQKNEIIFLYLFIYIKASEYC